MRARSYRSVAIPVSGLLSAHLILTLIHNLPDKQLSLHKLNARLPEIPTWQFFAPAPGVDDMHLLYRTMGDGEPVSDWDEINLSVERPWYSPIWNPGSRTSKVLFDAVQRLIRTVDAHSGDFESVTLSAPYRLLEDFVASAVERHPDSDAAQFMVLKTRPDPTSPKLQPILTSKPFPLDPATR